jgi:hypothetical protein
MRMAISEFREPTYPMKAAIDARMVFAMMLRELNNKKAFAAAGKCLDGTYTCPYCFRDEPHTVETHNDDRDRLERTIHSDAYLLDEAGLEWARSRLEKLQHAPKFDQPSDTSGAPHAPGAR